jgi:general secretion pathway protein D
LNLGDEIPVPSTVFGGLGAGGVNTIPISSFNYRPIGVIVKMKPRVTFENEIILDIEVENSTLGAPIDVAGQSLPTFGTRKVKTRMRLREGESNLLAGLVTESDRRVLRGVPGLMKVPILKDILGGTEEEILQTDIVILLTPRIVRTHELTQDHLNPIYIGSQLNLGLTGPTPVIGDPMPAEPVAGAPAGAPATPPPGGLPPAGGPTPGGVTSTPGIPPPPSTTPATPPAGGPGTPIAPPGTGPGTPITPEPAAPPAPPGSGETPPASAPAAAAQPAALAPVTVTVSTPGPEFRVGGGPYTVPLAVSGAQRLSIMSVTLTYNPATVRVRSVQEGPFFRQGGATQAFNHQIDAAAGRVDISVTRAGDQTGASGSGLVAALVFDAVASGTAPFGLTGVAATVDGRSVPVTFVPASVTVQ